MAAIDDTLTALDYLQARPDVDRLQTVLTGGSAGAMTALFVAYGLDDYGIDRPMINAVIDNWGAFGWINLPGDADLIDGSAAGFVEQNPFYWYAEGPVFVAHGTNDPLVPYWHAQEIVDRAAAVGLPYVLHAQTGAGHGFNLFTTEFSPGVSVFQAQVNWLDSILPGIYEPPTTTTTTTTTLDP